MKGGVLGVPTTDFDRIEPYRGLRQTNGQELTDQIEITGVQRTSSGLDITEGKAAREELGRRESVALEFDTIAVEGTEDVVTRHTEFASIPGELVVVGGSSGEFLYDVLDRKWGIDVSRASIDLDGLLEEFADPTLWKVGFHDREGGAANGVIHGDAVLDDPAFAESIATAPKNQLGLLVDHDGEEYKLNATASGYFEVYQPSDLSTKEFLEFVRERVKPHLTAGE